MEQCLQNSEGKFFRPRSLLPAKLSMSWVGKTEGFSDVRNLRIKVSSMQPSLGSFGARAASKQRSKPRKNKDVRVRKQKMPRTMVKRNSRKPVTSQIYRETISYWTTSEGKGRRVLQGVKIVELTMCLKIYWEDLGNWWSLVLIPDKDIELRNNKIGIYNIGNSSKTEIIGKKK